MSSTTEALLEQILEREDAIRAASESGHDTRMMREELHRLRRQLDNAGRALTSNEVLKG